MRGVYQSLKVTMQNTLQRGKTNTTPLVEGERSEAPSLKNRVSELQTIIVGRIGSLREAVEQREAAVAVEAERVEHLIGTLKANVAALEAKLKDTEENVERKESVRQKMQESLAAKMHDLENDLKEKEELLKNRDREIEDLKANVDHQVRRIAELEAVLDKANTEAATQAKRLEDLSESSSAKTTALETQLREAEEIARQKDATITSAEQNLSATVKDFETQLGGKDELLARRNAEIKELKSQLQTLARGIEDMSSFFKQTEAFAAIGREDVSAAGGTAPASRAGEKPPTPRSISPSTSSDAADPAREIASPDVFDRITTELAEATGVMRSIASAIVRDHVVALGESMDSFPRSRLPDLLESLSNEISDDKLKVGFRGRLAQDTQVVGHVVAT